MATTHEVKPRISVTKDEAAQSIANAIQKLSMNDSMGAAKELCEVMNPKSFTNPFVNQTQPKAKKTRKATDKPKGPRTIFEKCRIVLLKEMSGNGNERMRNAMQQWSTMSEQERYNMAQLYDARYSVVNDEVINEVHDEEQEEEQEKAQEEAQDKSEGEIVQEPKTQVNTLENTQENTQEKKRGGRKKKDDASTSKVEKQPTRKTKKADKASKADKAEEAPVALENEAYPSEDEKENQNQNENVIYETRDSDEEDNENADDTHDVECRSSDVDE